MAYIISLILLITGLIMGHSEANTEAPSQAPTGPSKSLSYALEQTHIEAPVQAPNTSVEVARKWANVMIEQADIELMWDVNLVFTNEHNCGAELGTAGIGGCTYTLADGSHTVVISPELANTQWGNHILFHELGHTVGMGECEAEAFAHQYEEVELWSYPLCETTGQPE